MNEEFIDAVKKTLPAVIVAAAAFFGGKMFMNYRAGKAAAASEAVAAAYSTDEIEEAVSSYGGSKAGDVLRLRLAKSYYDAGRYDEAAAIYTELAGKAPQGLEGVPEVGLAQCLEAQEKFAEAIKAYGDFAAANTNSFLALTANLGAARATALAGDRKKAAADLEALLAKVSGDAVSKARVEATLDLVKRYTKRVEVSLFDAADAAAKQIDAAAGVKPEAAKNDSAEPAKTK
jgi:predicted negative regulator of RcsB-dependent stress response